MNKFDRTCLLITRKNYCNIFLQKQLTVFSSIAGLYVDGTFKSAPKFFHQLFTILGLSSVHYVHLAFFLQANKHPTCYDDVFRRTVSYAAKTGVNFFPTMVYADFQTAIHIKVKTVWPGLEVKACRFHFGQSWWRKMQSLGLRKQHGKKESKLSQFLKKIFGLSLILPAEVCEFFALEFSTNLPNDKRVEQFRDNLLENYIDADSNFPLPLWSECTV